MIIGVPVNVICGPLGVGKTTLINQLLAQRPAAEQWAVLVNEYGLVGLDAALMESAGGTASVAVKEVAGGCICCSAGPVFEVTLIQLLRRKPDRLLIEPTGLATLSGILDTLNKEGIRDAVDLRSIVCLLNPATLEHDLAREEVRDQVDAADALIASRADLASTDELQHFRRWASALFPARSHIAETAHGRLPAAVLNLRHRIGGATAAPGDDHHHHDHGHHDDQHTHTIDHGVDRSATGPQTIACEQTPIVPHLHRSAQTTTFGWICWAGLVFDAERAAKWMESLTDIEGLRRLKAVLHTSRGWRAFNVTEDLSESRGSAYRRDSRVELIIEGDRPPDPAALEASLRGCLHQAAG
ncbi:MAG: CobW family GTP-binding protein [Pseudomonadota bacterium]